MFQAHHNVEFKENTSATQPINFIMVATIAPNPSKDAENATLLAHSLRRSGGYVHTATAEPDSYASIILNYRTRRLTAITHNALQKATSAPFQFVLYPTGLGFDEINKSRWASRRMEEVRRLRTAVYLARHATRTDVILTSPFALVFAIVLLLVTPLSVRLRSRNTSVKKLCKAISGKGIISAPLKDASEMLRVHAKSTRGRHIPSRHALRSVADRLGDTNLARDLREIFDLGRRLNQSGIPLITNANTLSSTSTLSNMEMVNIVNEGTALPGITRYMQHYNSCLSKPFELTNPQARRRFLNWYVNAHSSCKSCSPMPLSSDDILHPPPISDTIFKTTARILQFAHRITDVSHFRTDDVAYLATPLGGDQQNLSRMELLFAVMSGKEPQSMTAFREPWKAAEIRDWFHSCVCKTAPALHVFSTKQTQKPVRIEQKTVMVHGLPNGNTGISRNAVMSEAALRLCSNRILRATTLHHVNADKIPQQILSSPSAFQIGFLLWELEEIPRSHRLAGHMLDKIWVPSSYLQSIYTNQYQREVHNIGKGIIIPEVFATNLTKIGIDSDCYCFLVCFDSHSSVERKNPVAAVLAFQMAFQNGENVKILVKSTPISVSHWGDPNGQLAQIKRLAKRDKRIVVDTRFLSFNTLHSVIKRADCLVSPHRAEGFGYLPAYALGHGTPVISTNYSGTTDFCTYETSFPVSFDLVDVQPNESIYPVKNAYWANISVAQLASTMSQVYMQPHIARARAAEGRNMIKTRYSMIAQSRRYTERLVEYGVFEP